LVRYFETIRERIWVVVGVTLLTLVAAVIYLSAAENVYESQVELLVTPVAEEDPALTGLSLVRASSDPTRDVETVARLVTSRSVAADVKRELGLDESVQQLSANVSAAPVAQSNIVVISALENSPGKAARIANAYAENAIEERNRSLRRQLGPLIDSLRERISSGGVLAGDPTLSDQLARLESLQAGGDHTVRVESAATPSDSAVEPRPALTIAAALIGGLVLGVGAAFLTRALDPRLRREEQLRERYSLPVLARIPRERKAVEPGSVRGRSIRRPVPLSPSALSPQTLEAYRSLRTMLSAAVPEREGKGGLGRAILVTGPSPVEGKTTTAINLASSYALAGKSVILIEADFRHPKIAVALKVVPEVGIGDVLLGEAELDRALVRVKPFGPVLRLLAAQKPDDRLSELLSMPAARRLLDEARALADYVIIDSPPLTEVIDALPLAHYVDDLLLVCRLGTSSLLQLSRLGDLLEQNQIVPRGFVVVGVSGSQTGSYYLETTGRGPDLGPEEEPRKPSSAADGSSGTKVANR
jgi:succinoglycan biosynthesis transport protein ExoP